MSQSNHQNMETEILFDPNSEPQDARLAQLKQLFPDCFDKNGVFLAEKMVQALRASDINTSKEYYTMNWLGKSYAKVLRDLPPETLLAENNEHNSKPEHKNSQNLLIKGDNLEVLKHLTNAYKGAVKMIYIDPPYNTGSDGFVYQDDRKFTAEQLAKLGGMDLDEAQRVLDFTAKKSNSHSAWLTFMYPRLYIARELLKDDGVIFISIDDNEQAQLKLLCDEVFGEENFVGDFIKQSKVGGGNDSKFIVKEHEYCFCYAKDIEKLQPMNIQHDDEYLKRYKEEDENGKYFWDTFARPGLKNPIYYDIQCPDGSIVNNGWIRSKERFEKEYKEGIVRMTQKPNGEWSVQFKQYLNQDGKTPRSMTTDFGGTTDGDKELKLLFPSKVFSYPKSIRFIKTLLSIINDKNSLILDFFAGSGTTAHAVMQLNAEDGGNRQFIMVQLPETTDPKSETHKAGYQTIFDITQARIEKAATKIQADKPDYQGDLGFKIFETVEDFRTLPELENEDTTQTTLLFPNLSQLTTAQTHTLLTTWRVYDGQKLPKNTQLIDLAGYTAYLCDKHLYLLHNGFTSKQIKALLDKLDEDKTFVIERIVLLGDAIDSAKQQELNQAIKTYANKKSLNISVLVRY